MASTKDYRDFVLEQLSLLNDITYKPMMGEYMLYYNGLLFGGIYDDRLLVKKVDSNKDYDMQQITVNCCHKDIALMPADITAGFYCPYCGRIIK